MGFLVPVSRDSVAVAGVTRILRPAITRRDTARCLGTDRCRVRVAGPRLPATFHGLYSGHLEHHDCVLAAEHPPPGRVNRNGGPHCGVDPEHQSESDSLCCSQHSTRCEQHPRSGGCTHDVPVQLLQSRSAEPGAWWCFRGAGRRRHGFIRQSCGPRAALEAGGLGGRTTVGVFDTVNSGRTFLGTAHRYAPRQLAGSSNRDLP